ncbi:hypothetical protein BDR26DRAFT_875658 [Obelidium mucronatum]|nr:hypothetical protein BDR26DRAFT_875658 [Obelidium mucronatum]
MSRYVASIEVNHANSLIQMAGIKARNAKEGLETLLARDYQVVTTVYPKAHKLVFQLKDDELEFLNKNITIPTVPTDRNLFNKNLPPTELVEDIKRLWEAKGAEITQAFGRTTNNSREIVVSLYFNNEQKKAECLRNLPYAIYNRNTVTLTDESEAAEIRQHRERTHSLVIRDIGRRTTANEWKDAIHQLGKGVESFRILRGDTSRRIPFALEVLMKSSDDAKKRDPTKYKFHGSNTTYTFIWKMVKKQDGTYRPRDDCKHCHGDHLQQNCDAHNKAVETRLMRLGDRPSYTTMNGEEVSLIRSDIRELENKGIRLSEAQARGCDHLNININEKLRPLTRSTETTRQSEQWDPTPNRILTKAQRTALQGTATAGTSPLGRTMQTEEDWKEELKQAVQAEVAAIKAEMETKMEAEMERVKGELEEKMEIWMKEKENSLNDQWAKIQNDMDEETIKPLTETREETETGEETDQSTKLEPLDEEMVDKEKGETLGEAIIGEIKVLNKEIFGYNEGEEEEYIGLKKRVVKLEELWRKHQRKENTRKTIGKKSAGVEYTKRHDGKGKKWEKKKRPETGRTDDE